MSVIINQIINKISNKTFNKINITFRIINSLFINDNIKYILQIVKVYNKIA